MSDESVMRSVISVIMSHPVIYSNVTRILRGKTKTQRFFDTYVRPWPGCQILDIGCGPGDALNFLPSVDYYGFDQDPYYIESAKKRFENKGQFFCRAVSRDAFSGENKFDIILAMGILHHLNDDEAKQLFELAYHLLKPGGRLITYDGCYTKTQSWMRKFILDIDRGKFVRDEKRYTLLAAMTFAHLSPTVREDLLNVPYTIIIIECQK
jgi:SAM-dependent methyltransferase